MPTRHATLEDLHRYRSLRLTQVPRGRFIGEGPQVVRRMLDRGRAEEVLCTPEWVERLGLSSETPVLLAEERDLRQIIDWRFHHCVMALGTIPPPRPISGGLLVALDGLSNSENVGAILRSCACFGADGVIVGPGTASPWLRRAVRVGIGAPLDVPVHFTEDLAATLRPLAAYAAHVVGDHVPYTEVDLAADCCLVLGGEDQGVSPAVIEACRATIKIPMAPGWDCLNVAASAAVVLSEARRQRASLARGGNCPPPRSPPGVRP